jgi:hypothetical protein
MSKVRGMPVHPRWVSCMELFERIEREGMQLLSMSIVWCIGAPMLNSQIPGDPREDRALIMIWIMVNDFGVLFMLPKDPVRHWLMVRGIRIPSMRKRMVWTR